MIDDYLTHLLLKEKSQSRETVVEGCLSISSSSAEAAFPNYSISIPNKMVDLFLSGHARVSARRVSMMELGAVDRMRLEKADDGSHSLPDCWSAQRMRLNSFACSAQMPSLSTALITSSSDSSDDVDEEEEKA